MNLFELKYLIVLQLAIDFAIFVVFIFLIRRLRFLDKGSSSLNSKLKIYESFLTDADKISVKFKEMLQEKKDIIKKLNEQLEKRIKNLNTLLNRADALIFKHRQSNQDGHVQDSLTNHTKKIVELAKEGFDLDYISESLVIPKEEVMLVLDLKKKISQLDPKEGVS
jgi:cell shape-determining protein MreC